MNTPVIFRKYKEGDIIAIFPTELGTDDPGTCSSYQHIGQHGSCDPQGVISATKPATQEEYVNLLVELTQIGYTDLQRYQRYQNKWYQYRINELNKFYKEV